MSEDRIMILLPRDDDFWAKRIKEKKIVDVFATYKNKGMLYAAVRKVMACCGLFLFLFFEEWKTKIFEYDMIILQASKITAKIPDWLRKKGYNGRIVYYYWDPVSGSVNPKCVNRGKCELWSFDYMDCKKYDMNFNDTYYLFNESDIEKKNNNDCYDFLFVGKDKGRAKFILLLENRLKKLGYVTYFNVVRTKNYSRRIKGMGRQMPYEEVLDLVKKSRCIVDINQSLQSGLSQRCMEALFFGKKLLTNNEYTEFYKCFGNGGLLSNMMTDEVDFRFIDDESYKIDEDIYRYYTFENWLNGFYYNR